MPGNSFGEVFRITTFGESHGPAVGVIIDGCPAGLEFKEDVLIRDLQRRKPGQSEISSPRKEDEDYEILSGIFENRTLGTPIAIVIRNKDQQSSDYDHIAASYRPSHADYVYDAKYGLRDHRGGGRSSARETAVRVAAGAIAKMLLAENHITIGAYVSQVGPVKVGFTPEDADLSKVEDNIVRCPEANTANKMIEYINEIRETGDTCGGVISCLVKGMPVGMGEPVFNKLHADLAHAMMGINAAKGFGIGKGFEAAGMKGSVHNDIYEMEGEKVVTKTNNSAGIQGGISNGMDIYFDVAFKPVSTLMTDQPSVDKDGNEIVVEGKGRHDPCVVPRAVPIVEAMASLVMADHFLMNRLSKMT
ncbi:MAG: chorismate synthase [Bacteroidetes bacterium]|nr:chorismate synthase [Bacteroidota bacterium]